MGKEIIKQDKGCQYSAYFEQEIDPHDVMAYTLTAVSPVILGRKTSVRDFLRNHNFFDTEINLVKFSISKK